MSFRKYKLFWLSYFIILGMSAAAAIGLTPFDYQFSQSQNILSWNSPDTATSLNLSESYLQLTTRAPFPYIVSPPLHCLAEEYPMLIVRMKTSKPDTATVFWATDFDQQFNQNKSVNFSLGAPNQFHTYYVNLRQQHPAWASKIIRLGLSPFAGVGQAQIEFIRLDEETFFSNLLSGWQEFWGPTGRTVIGSTINVIQSCKLWGHSVNVYCYWMIAIISIGFLLYDFGSQKVISKTCEKAFPKILITFLIFFVLLEMNNCYNELLQFQADWRDYAGKSLDQKYSQALGSAELFDFLKFCQKFVPEKATYQLKTSIFTGPKAEYYFIPRIPQSDNPQYLLLFQPNETVNVAGYKLLTKTPDLKGEIYKKL